MLDAENDSNVSSPNLALFVCSKFSDGRLSFCPCSRGCATRQVTRTPNRSKMLSLLSSFGMELNSQKRFSILNWLKFWEFKTEKSSSSHPVSSHFYPSPNFPIYIVLVEGEGNFLLLKKYHRER